MLLNSTSNVKLQLLRILYILPVSCSQTQPTVKYIYNVYAETPAITVLDLGQRQHVQSEGADKDWGHNNASIIAATMWRTYSVQ